MIFPPSQFDQRQIVLFEHSRRVARGCCWGRPPITPCRRPGGLVRRTHPPRAGRWTAGDGHRAVTFVKRPGNDRGIAPAAGGWHSRRPPACGRGPLRDEVLPWAACGRRPAVSAMTNRLRALWGRPATRGSPGRPGRIRPLMCSSRGTQQLVPAPPAGATVNATAARPTPSRSSPIRDCGLEIVGLGEPGSLGEAIWLCRGWAVNWKVGSVRPDDQLMSDDRHVRKRQLAPRTRPFRTRSPSFCPGDHFFSSGW